MTNLISTGRRLNSNGIRLALGILVGLPILLWAVWQIGRDTLKPLAFGIAGLAVLIVLMRRDSKRMILMAAFGGVVLGWRGFEISPGLRVFPSELFVWLGVLNYLSSKLTHGRDSTQLGLPMASLLLAFVSLVGLGVAATNLNSMTDAVVEAKAFIIFFPILVLLRSWVRSVEDVSLYVRVLVVCGTIIAALGLLERFFPSVGEIAPWFFTNPTEMRVNVRGTDMILLSGFSSWGGTIVAVILVPCVALSAALQKQRVGAKRTIWIVSEVVLVAGIVVSGYRSSWLGLITVFAVLFTIYRSSFFLYVAGAATAVYFLPAEYSDRFNTILLLSKSGDSSMVTRASAIERGLQSVWDNPLSGTGWGSQTVFNDWLYLAIALGLPALAIFAFWYFSLLGRLWRRIGFTDFPAQSYSRHLMIGFLAGLAGYGVCMVSGAMSQVPPLMVSFWLIFCLGERLVRLEATAGAPTALMERYSQPLTSHVSN